MELTEISETSGPQSAIFAVLFMIPFNEVSVEGSAGMNHLERTKSGKDAGEHLQWSERRDL